MVGQAELAALVGQAVRAVRVEAAEQVEQVEAVGQAELAELVAVVVQVVKVVQLELQHRILGALLSSDVVVEAEPAVELYLTSQDLGFQTRLAELAELAGPAELVEDHSDRSEHFGQLGWALQDATADSGTIVVDSESELVDHVPVRPSCCCHSARLQR